MTTPGASRRRVAGVVALVLLLSGGSLAIPAANFLLHSESSPGGSSDASPMLSLGPGGAAVTELYAVYNSRGDLQAAFPQAETNLTNFTRLVTWAGGVVTGVNTDSSYPALALYGYYYALMETYNGRPDLQAALPNAYTNGSNYHKLVTWAGGVVTGAGDDSSYSTLAPFGYYYALMATYYERSDLQTAFPHAGTNATNYRELVTWAGGVVSRDWVDSSYSTLAPFGWYYALMSTYNARPDLQSALPNAYTSFVNYTILVNWAGGVVNGEIADSSLLTLLPFGYYYDMMTVYDGRADLMAALPAAYTNWGQYRELAYWSGEVVNGTVPEDSSQPALAVYGYWYVLFGFVYAERPDLQAAAPNALTDGATNQAMLAWAKGVSLGEWTDSAYSTLAPFASTYSVLG